MALEITLFNTHLESLITERNNILLSSSTLEEKREKLTLFDKENDELNQSLDIFYRMVDYEGLKLYRDIIATKADITQLPDLTPYAKTSDIPALPDLTPYAKTSDIPVLPDLTPYAKTSDIPALPDLTPYAKTSDIPVLPDFSPYAKISDIPTLPDLSPYAKTSDIPALPDLTRYAKLFNKSEFKNIYDASFPWETVVTGAEGSEHSPISTTIVLEKPSLVISTFSAHILNTDVRVFLGQKIKGDVSRSRYSYHMRNIWMGHNHTISRYLDAGAHDIEVYLKFITDGTIKPSRIHGSSFDIQIIPIESK